MPIPRDDLTAEFVRSIFDYDPQTGVLRWKDVGRGKQGGNSRRGKEAGCVNFHGYRTVNIQKKPYYVHRIIYLWMTGKWPDALMDHKTGDRSDNRWDKIRPANSFQNVYNQRKSKRNTSGYKGVTWRRNRSRWIAQIVANGKYRYLGSFPTREEAYEAYCDAAIDLHKNFARLA